MRVTAYIVLLVGLMATQPCLSQEYFGQFLDVLEGQFVDVEPRQKELDPGGWTGIVT